MKQPGESPRGRPPGGLTAPALVGRVSRFFHHKHTGLVLILAWSVLTLVGVLFQQAPDDVRADPALHSAWLDSVRPRYRGWTDPLSWAGVFGVFSSVWFRGVTTLLALSILACSVHRTPLLWAAAVHPHTHATDSFFDHARLRGTVALAADAGETLARAERGLRARRFRVLRAGEGALYADRNRFAPFGTVVAHLAFVVILVGVLVTSTFGFRDDQFTAPVGMRTPVGHGTGLTVEDVSFSDTYQDDGRPKDYASELVLYRGDERVAAQTVRVNEPLRLAGVSFHQSSFGIAAELAVDNAGAAAVHHVALQWKTEDGARVYGKVALPEQRLLVYVIGAASGQQDPEIAPGQMRPEVYRDGENQPLAAGVLTQGEPVTLGGATFTFVRERQFTGLMVSRDPGEPFVWLGSALLIGGVFLTMFWRHRRVWVWVRPAGSGSALSAASPDGQDSASDKRFHEFLDGLTGSDPGDPPRKAGK